MRLYNYTFKNLSNSKIYATMAMDITQAITQVEKTLGRIDYFTIYDEKVAVATFDGCTYVVRRA